MNELILVKASINELSNKTLKKSLNKVFTEYGKAVKATTSIALELGAIVQDETYKDDFKSVSELASYVGLRATTLYTYQKALLVFKELDEDERTAEHASQYSITQLTELNRLPNTENIVEFVVDNEITPSTSCATIRSLVKDVTPPEEAEDAPEETEDTPEETEEVESIRTDAIPESNVHTELLESIVTIMTTWTDEKLTEFLASIKIA